MSDLARKGPPVLPNPWPPDSINRLIEIAVLTGGLAPTAYKLIALWIEDRKARRIRIKHGEYEIEIQGGVSGKEIDRAFGKLRKIMIESGNEDMKIILPPGVDRSISLDLVREAHKEKGRKK